MFFGGERGPEQTQLPGCFRWQPLRYLDEWPYVGLNMSRSLGDAKLHQVGVSDVPDVSALG